MTSENAPVISIAVMFHPARVGRIDDLVQACAPLVPTVVVDPDPTGVPSPLRTAKRAWAAVPAGATHHLVLQDDVELVPDFAAHLLEVVRRRPDEALALCVNWDSPQNSYLVRRAVSVGSAWAPLSDREWTPTLGLVLPAAHARHLSTYLAGFDDEYRDDDELITSFCRDRALPVTAVVPHLLNHGDAPSLAGNESHGARHATVLADHTIDIHQWSRPPGLVSALRHPAHPRDRPGFVIRIFDSRCEIRFLRAASTEPVEHFYSWAWPDWSGLIGVEPEFLLRAWESFSQGPHPVAATIRRAVAEGMPTDLALEVWAAGFLLGADASTVRAQAHGPGLASVSRAGHDPTLMRAAMRSWIESGLSPADHGARPASDRAALVDLALVAVSSAPVDDVVRPVPVSHV